VFVIILLEEIVSISLYILCNHNERASMNSIFIPFSCRIRSNGRIDISLTYQISSLSFFFAEEIAKLFPNLFGQPSAALVLSDSHVPPVNQKLKISVVLSGGQAPGGHNVISGIFGKG